MTGKEEKALACIIGGYWPVKIKDCQHNKYKIHVKPLKKEFRPFLEDFYLDTLEELLSQGYMSDVDYQDFLSENNVNVKYIDSQIEDLKDDIENLKVEAFESFLDPINIQIIKENIFQKQEKLNFLFSEKHQYYHLSAVGQAEIEKNRLSLALCSYWESGKPVTTRKKYSLFPVYILEQTMMELKNIRPNDKELRNIARSDFWTSIFSASKRARLFQTSVFEMFDEQINLINWSNLYASIQKHPEKPINSVINDDILLDGWMICQRRKSDSKSHEVTATGGISERIKNNYAEIYIPAKNKKMVKNIYNLNEAESKKIIKKNQDYLRKGKNGK